MSESALVIRSTRLVTPSGTAPGTLHAAGGRITRISSVDDVPSAADIVDVGDRVVMAGLVDTHVHIDEPGRADWEGFESGTRAAAAGGVTTIVDMPLNSLPATTTTEALEAKRRAADGQCWIDAGFWGGVVPGNTGELEPMFDAGALGFKCFMVPSGVDDFPHVSEADLRMALPVLARLGATLLVHAELPEPIARATAALGPGDSAQYARYLASRPDEAEVSAVSLVARLAAETGARVHVVHLSSAAAIPIIEHARRTAVRMTAETCPHYLYFAAEEVPRGATAYKCAPPIRAAAHRDALWQALERGVIDQIVSDHAPSLPSMKCVESGDFLQAWGGISSLQLGLPIVWTRARNRGWSFSDLSTRMSARPAELAGLAHRKGRLDTGRDADVVVWDPEAEFEVDVRRLYHRHPVTPYAGQRLAGRVDMTFLRGARIYDRGSFAARPTGSWLARVGAHGLH